MIHLSLYWVLQPKNLPYLHFEQSAPYPDCESFDLICIFEQSAYIKKRPSTEQSETNLKRLHPVRLLMDRRLE